MKRLIVALLLTAFAGFAAAQAIGPYSPVGASANVAYTGTAGSTGTLQAGPSLVMVFCTTTCFVKIGEGVTATTSDIPLPANVAAIFRVPPGTGAPWRVSAIQQSSGGSVFAQPVN